MAQANLNELKPQYLELIDLIRRHRILELGKTGPTHIPKAEIDAIAPGNKIDRFLQALAGDGVIDEVVTRGKEMVINCRMTAEQMLTYRRSLIIQGALGLQVNSYRGAFYKMQRNGQDGEEQLSDREGQLLSLLMEHPNEPVTREVATGECNLTDAKISSAMNSIRGKIGRLGFTDEEVAAMLPVYRRGELIFMRNF